MSASLVGSEMCIRDRLCTCPCPSLGPGREKGDGHPVRRHKGEGAGRHPVSYTHLTLPTICSV
eukprot:4790911-Alexandrium_andersonii.AAC.1